MNDEEVLMLRYSNTFQEDCMNLHIQVNKKCGYCWFGKIGRAPSDKLITKILKNKHPQLMLYSLGEQYLCELLDVSKSRPSNGFPEYYKKVLFSSGMEPSIYFKLGAMKKLERKNLEKYYIISSGRSLLETVGKTMSAFLVIGEKKEGFTEPAHLARNRKQKNASNTSSICKYQKDGLCNCKTSINYQYECDRPRMCIKRTE